MTEHPSFKLPFIPPGEPVPGKTYRADGWALIDFDVNFSPDMWSLMLGIIGEEEYVILATTKGSTPDKQPFIRGQFLTSPKGYETLTQWAKEKLSG